MQTITLHKVRQLPDLAAKLKALAAEMEHLWSTLDCDCEGTCPICRSLIHTANDVRTLADRCREEAQADDFPRDAA